MHTQFIVSNSSAALNKFILTFLPFAKDAEILFIRQKKSEMENSSWMVEAFKNSF